MQQKSLVIQAVVLYIPSFPLQYIKGQARTELYSGDKRI